MIAFIRFNNQCHLTGYKGLLKVGLFLLFLFSIELLSAQPFEVTVCRHQVLGALGIEKVTFDLDAEECGYPQFIGSAPILIQGMATCPNGEVFVKEGGTPQDLYLFDPNSGDLTYYASPPPSLPDTVGHIHGLICPENDVFIYILSDSYYYRVDLNQDTAIAMEPTGFGDNPFTTYNGSNDMTLMNGKGYRPYNDVVIPPVNLGIVEFDPLDPSNSSLVVETGGFPDMIWALAPTPHCNILIGSGGPAFGQGISAWVFNVGTGDFYKLCDLDWDWNIRDMTTPYEHEEQECNLVINLDFLEETNAPEYDYLNPDPYTCLSEGASIAHEVVFIATHSIIDYMTVELIEPLPDGAKEYLKVDGNVPGITVTGDETTSLLLTNDGSATTQNFLDILQLIYYHNDAMYPTEGRRSVEVQFVVPTSEASNVATGMVDVEELEIIEVDIGEDEWICEGERHVISSGQPDMEHIWSTGEDTPEIEVLESGQYSLTLSDGVRCPGQDSMQLEVRPLIELEIEVEEELCQGDDFLFRINSGSDYAIDFEIVSGSGEVLEVVEGMIQTHLFFINGLQESISLGIQQVHSATDLCIEFSEELHEIEILPVYEVEDTAQICAGDSILYSGEWFKEAGPHELEFETQMGCDSTLRLELVVLPVDTSIQRIYTCDPQGVDTSVVMYQNQHGCDSVVLQITEYYSADSTFLTTISCDPEEEQLVVDTFLNQLGCDSLVFSGVQYLPPDSTSLILNTCNPDEQGSYTDTLTNQYGCDSLVFVQINYFPPDTFISVEFTCEESEAEYIEEQYTNQWGCDSLVISVVEYIPPDSTITQLTSCDPEDEGVFVDSLTNLYGCDSLIFTEVSFSLADSTFLTAYSCDQADSGLIIDSLRNQQGCDSLVFTQVNYSPPDTIYEFDTDCDPDMEGITVMTLQNSMGCDSVIITQVDLLPSDSTFLESTTCDPQQAGTQVSQFINQWGCDSTVVVEVELLPSDEVFLYEATCDPQQAGIFTETFENQWGCDSLVNTEVELMPSDTTFLLFTDCGAGQADTSDLLLENQHGCDSLVLSITVPVDPPEVELLSVGDYNGYDLSCAGASDGSLRSLVEEGIPPYQSMWEDGSTGFDRDQVSEGLYSMTVTDDNDCTAADSILLSAPDSLHMELLVTHPACFDDQTGGIEITAVGGAPPYEYRINSESFQDQSAFPGLAPGVFELSLRDANGCVTNEIVIIQSPEELEVNLGEDQEIVPGDSALLEIITNVPYDSLSEIDWKGLQDPDCDDCPIVYDRPVVSTTYSVTITDQDGCMASDDMTVTVNQNQNIYIPNAFSPNADGINDYFTVYADDRQVKSIRSLQIFSRFGDRVFHRGGFQPNQPELGWDGYFRGELMNPAVFVWMAEVEFVDGEVVVLSGEVSLVR